MKYLRRGGGYYFNVGASDLIVEGKINLLHHKDIDRVVANGLLMKDGSVAEADVIVAATATRTSRMLYVILWGTLSPTALAKSGVLTRLESSAICGAVRRNPAFGLSVEGCRTSESSRSISLNR